MFSNKSSVPEFCKKLVELFISVVLHFKTFMSDVKYIKCGPFSELMAPMKLRLIFEYHV